MIDRLKLIAVSVCAAAALSGHAAAEPQLANVFADQMVVQRGAPVKVWGDAAPGETVSVSFAGGRRTATADENGAWSVELPARRAGGPYTLTVKSDQGEQTVEDVLVGDVWLCSGQSNMEYPVYRALNPDWELSKADPNSGIRFLTVEKANTAAPQQSFSGEPAWRKENAETLRHFSAACYFFARDLQTTEDVPLGLVHSSWGGSQIEAWVGPKALGDLGGFEPQLELLDLYGRDPGAALAAFGAQWETWWNGLDGVEQDLWKQASLKGWKKTPAPMRDYKAYGDPELADHTGMVWFKNTFRLTAEQSASDGELHLGRVDEADAVWLNGKFVSASFGWGDERHYPVSADMLQEGENVITVNVYNSWGAGGMTGPEDAMSLAFEDGDAVPLGEGWRYLKSPSSLEAPPRTPWESVRGYTSLSNAMIAPLGEMRMKGAVWYQGESNADRAGAYGGLLEALIKDWRSRFGAELKVIVVQLPNFGLMQTGPSDSGWARLRDEQRRVADADPNTGLVVTMDVGDNQDIHPPNKLAVGRRAADVARAIAYGAKGLAADGHSPAAAVMRDAGVAVQFPAAVKPEHVLEAAGPIGFQLCDAKGECAYAQAALADGAVLVSSPDVEDPAAVRYCWSDAPICNLYDDKGRPYTPFELSVGAD